MPGKANNFLIISLFIAAIFMPLIFSDKAGGKISATENRYLAKFPKILTNDRKLASGTRNSLENWIKDNVGGREAALIINKTISYNLFRVFPEENVVEGKDHWLFMLPGFDIPNYVNSNLPTKEKLNWLKENFTRIAGEFKKRDIEFGVMIWPNQFYIYPEYFPNKLQKVNDESAIEILDKELTNNPNFDFRTALSTLRSGKQERQTYYKAFNTSHWNQYGAFLGYTDLMSQIQQHLPAVRILTEKDFTVTPVIAERNTSLGLYTQEEDLQYTLNGGNHAHSDMEFFNKIGFISHDPWKSYNYYINSDRSLPKAVVIGDSFTWEFMLPNLSESFSELVFIHHLDMGSLNDIIYVVHPDIVIMAGLGPDVVDTFASYVFPALLNLDSKILLNTAPLEVEQGEKYTIDITVRNIGTETWNENRKIRLAVFQDGYDRHRITIPDGVDVEPGETYTFRLENFEAPTGEAVNFGFQMVEEGVQYFGEKRLLIATSKNDKK